MGVKKTTDKCLSRQDINEMMKVTIDLNTVDYEEAALVLWVTRGEWRGKWGIARLYEAKYQWSVGDSYQVIEILEQLGQIESMVRMPETPWPGAVAKSVRQYRIKEGTEVYKLMETENEAMEARRERARTRQLARMPYI